MTNEVNRWIRRKIKEVKIKCEECGSRSYLEFAHIKQTKLKGIGRGRKERYYDYVKNPESYKILCEKCHKELDKNEINNK